MYKDRSAIGPASGHNIGALGQWPPLAMAKATQIDDLLVDLLDNVLGFFNCFFIFFHSVFCLCFTSFSTCVVRFFVV